MQQDEELLRRDSARLARQQIHRLLDGCHRAAKVFERLCVHVGQRIAVGIISRIGWELCDGFADTSRCVGTLRLPQQIPVRDTGLAIVPEEPAVFGIVGGVIFVPANISKYRQPRISSGGQQ